MRHKQLLLIGAPVLAVVAFAVQQTAAQKGGGETVSVLHVEFRATELKKGKDLNPVVVEEGAHWIMPERRRRDTLNMRTGERFAYIEYPAARRRIRLDLARKHATISDTRTVMPPEGKGFLPHPPETRPEEVQTSQDLGEKDIEGLKLQGDMTTFDYGAGNLVTMEVWYYRFSDPRVLPIILEERVESPLEIYEKRIIGVHQTLVSSSIFDIPAGFETSE